MDGDRGLASGGDLRGDNGGPEGRIDILEIGFASSHGLLKGCGDGEGSWKNAGSPCPAPEWTPSRRVPISHTMGERLDISIRLLPREGAPAVVDVVGECGGAARFLQSGVRLGPGGVEVRVSSSRALPRRIAKVDLEVLWSGGGEALSPARTESVLYVTMSRPRDDEQGRTEEDGVTVKRMDRAVSWVAPLRAQAPHSIVRALMGKFPYYSLRPSKKVPRAYHHPTYFNDDGGAWAMSDYVEETGECQAIVRLVRAILRQLGVPGEARTLMVWADPEVQGGKKAVTAYWDESPGAGLDRTKVVNGKRWLATLVDKAVTVGTTYPASHTLENGTPSPGFNRYEACLEFTHEGVTRQYGGGAGVFTTPDSVLQAFWGLAWVSDAPNDGFKVEEIVAKYR